MEFLSPNGWNGFLYIPSLFVQIIQDISHLKFSILCDRFKPLKEEEKEYKQTTFQSQFISN